MLIVKVFYFLLLTQCLAEVYQPENFCLRNQITSNFSKHFNEQDLYQFESAYPTNLQLHPFYPYFFELDGSRKTLCHGIHFVFDCDVQNTINILPIISIFTNCTIGYENLFFGRNCSINNNEFNCLLIYVTHYYHEFINSTYSTDDIESFSLVIESNNRIAIKIGFRTLTNELINSMWVFIK